ncbi:hypothetical protein ACFV0L_21475 [Streptosporangium canum]|uniref:hypothetical protein n=1 Tax=Streptosporangium canum TaxID=324952 RepID=UPI003680E202
MPATMSAASAAAAPNASFGALMMTAASTETDEPLRGRAFVKIGRHVDDRAARAGAVGAVVQNVRGGFA